MDDNFEVDQIWENIVREGPALTKTIEVPGHKITIKIASSHGGRMIGRGYTGGLKQITSRVGGEATTIQARFGLKNMIMGGIEG